MSPHGGAGKEDHRGQSDWPRHRGAEGPRLGHPGCSLVSHYRGAPRVFWGPTSKHPKARVSPAGKGARVQTGARGGTGTGDVGEPAAVFAHTRRQVRDIPSCWPRRRTQQLRLSTKCQGWAPSDLSQPEEPGLAGEVAEPGLSEKCQPRLGRQKARWAQGRARAARCQNTHPQSHTDASAEVGGGRASPPSREPTPQRTGRWSNRSLLRTPAESTPGPPVVLTLRGEEEGGAVCHSECRGPVGIHGQHGQRSATSNEAPWLHSLLGALILRLPCPGPASTSSRERVM